ncbi:hypothetical protein [Asticcacaulis benevestitus]|uniref:EAL domain-containing protein n=1 Tax=Asticcacaulis benevestitus DSM 16100 = ATCC BAA-896 TaxID=1121022 RepID=V4P3G4_9CAUL|nr:hypothetical protein [Asticcacaulis benevestitus]ESQ88522.1 hypothetical protein ABENE_15870 [Asticcacaulis benevestitus DSM 16100 = ATCC BAA-896]
MSDLHQEALRGQSAGPLRDDREPFMLEHDDAVVIVERLRETHADSTGHAFLLKLDTLIVRLGAKWDSKAELVFGHLKNAFERVHPEPNWCIPIHEDSWMGILPEVGSRKGAQFMTEVWHELCNFFVGDMSAIEVPLYAVLVEDVDRLSLLKVDLKTFFDLQSADNGPLKARGHGPSDDGNANNGQRPVMVASILNFGGRNLKVASSVEPLFEMKKMILIGHRLESMVMEAVDNTLLDRKALSNLDWGLREMVDIMNIDQGLKLLKMRTPEQRKMMMVVPAAFSTFASARARQKITLEVQKAAAEMGLKVLFEVRGLDGVPPHRVLEIVSMIKPFCMTVVGSVSADRKMIATLAKCGLSGVCIEYDGGKRDEDSMRDYLSSLAAAAKLSAGACMVQGFDNYRQMAVARLAGVTHASMKTAALMSPKAPVSQVADG